MQIDLNGWNCTENKMDIKEYTSIKVILVCLLFLALAGGIFFMPMQLNGRYTCFYHRLIDKNQPVSTNHAGNGVMQLKNKRGPGEALPDMHSHGDDMVEMYISRYAFFWWGSIGLLIYCILRLRSKHDHGKEKIS